MISQKTIEEDYKIPHEKIRIMASQINSFHIDMAIVLTFKTFRVSSVRFSLTRLFDVVNDLENMDIDRYISKKVQIHLRELIAQGKIIITANGQSNNRNLYKKADNISLRRGLK